MKRLLSYKWIRVTLVHIILIGTVIALVLLGSLLLGSTCPTYALFGICCPFCGMTRAHLAALRLDFATAFSIHPAFFTGLPFLWLLAHHRLFEKKWQRVLWWVLTALVALVLFGTYTARVIIHQGFDFFA